MSILNFVPRARSEESPRSLLIRTAYHNGFKSVAKMIASLKGEHNARPFDWQLNNSSIAKLFATLDTNALSPLPFYSSASPITRGAPVIINDITIPLTLLKTKKHSICPACLAEGWQKYVQDFVILESCPYHHYSYIEQCPSCMQDLSWTECNGVFCKCGYDLRNSPKTYKFCKFADQLLLTFRNKNQNVFDSFLINLQALRYFYSTTHTEAKAIAELALDIAVSRDPMKVKAAIQRSIDEHEPAPELLFVAPWLLSNDEEIRNIANSFMRSPIDGSMRETSTTQLGKFWLRRDELNAVGINQLKLQNLSKLELITKVKIKTNTPFQYHSNNWASVFASLGSTGTRTIATSTPAHFDVDQAALYLDVYPEVVRRAVKAGFMTKNLKKGASGKMLIDAGEVSTFQRNYVFVGPLAKQLNSPNTTLAARLAAVGILPVSGPNVDGGLVTIYDRCTLDESKISTALTAETYSNNAGRKLHTMKPSDAHISSTDTAKILGIEMQRLKYLEKIGLLVQEIPPQFVCENRRYFTKKSVNSTQKKLSNSITVENLASELDLSPSTFDRRFIKSGFSTPIALGKRLLVSNRDAFAIRKNLQTYCSCDQADKYLNAPKGHSSNLISTGRLRAVPISESRIHTVRLIKWADIQALALAL
ncbi:TniQ family protein [Pseudomonas sp. NPDC088368]|uniref:TniQ family protein n=1 Tax=Pseudomonas sp. NPDC088368 TaxID=3364453 RepID=UPI0037FA92C8